MRQTLMHPNGPSVSALVFGTWRLTATPEQATPDAVARLIETALDAGIDSFDLADIYGGYQVEPLFGAALARLGARKSALKLITKCGICLKNAARPTHRVKHYNTSRAHIVGSLETSLKALGADQVELLLIHRPDPLMDADETAAGLTEVIDRGLARHVGVSNFTPAQIDLLQSRLVVPLVTNQIELSLTRTAPLTDGTLDHAQRLRMAPMAWSPLGGGGLFAATPDPALTGLLAALKQVAAELGLSDSGDDIGTLALAWLMQHPSRPIPVLGTGNADRIRRYARAADIALDRQQWFLLLEAANGRPVP